MFLATSASVSRPSAMRPASAWACCSSPRSSSTCCGRRCCCSASSASRSPPASPRSHRSTSSTTPCRTRCSPSSAGRCWWAACATGCDVRGREALVLALLVLSHWFLDALVHRPDLPLVPFGDVRVGLGLWNWMAATLLVEGTVFARWRLAVCARHPGARRGGTLGPVGPGRAAARDPGRQLAGRRPAERCRHRLGRAGAMAAGAVGLQPHCPT